MLFSFAEFSFLLIQIILFNKLGRNCFRMANLIFAFFPHGAVIFLYSFLHCLSFLFFFSFPVLLLETSGLLKHWRKHRMLVTNTAPCSWKIPTYRCHWATQTWIRVRKVHHKYLIWVSPLQVKLTLRPICHEATSAAVSTPWGQGPKYPLLK